MQTAILIACFVTGAIAMTGFVFMAYYAVQTLANLKPGIGVWQDVNGRPFNHIFMPSHLTSRGLEYRTKFFYAGGLYVVPPIILWVVLYSLVASGWLK